MKPQNVSCPNTFAEAQNLCMLIALSSVSWLCAKNLCVNTGPIDVGKYSYKMPSKPQQQRVCFREIEGIEPIYMGGLNQVLQLKDIFISSAIVSLRRHWFASMVCCSSPDLWPLCGRGQDRRGYPFAAGATQSYLDGRLLSFIFLPSITKTLSNCENHVADMTCSYVYILTNKPRYTQFYLKTNTIS